MAVHENRNGEVITTPSAIRAWTGLHRVTIYDAINEMEAAGFLTVITPFTLGRKSSGKFAPTWGSRSLQQPNQVDRVAYNNPIVSDGAETVDSLASAGAMYVSLSSSGITSSPVLENEELGQEGISNTRDAQGELISTDTPAWLTDLRTTPGYDLDAARERRLIQRVEAAAIPTQRLCEAATSIAAKWESYKWSPSNKRGYKRLDLTFFDWAKREGKNGQSQNGRHNGRYRAPGTDIPKAGTPEAHARWPAPAYDAP